MTPVNALETPPPRVLPARIGYDGQMTIAFCVLAFGRALDRYRDRPSVGADCIRRANRSIFTLGMNARGGREVLEAGPRFAFRMPDIDGRRFRDVTGPPRGEKGHPPAACERIALHVHLGSSRAAALPVGALVNLETLRDMRAGLPRPRRPGSGTGIRRRRVA